MVLLKLLCNFVLMSSKPPKFFAPSTIKVSDEYEILRTMVFLYSSYRKAVDPKRKVLRPKLIELLCIYIMYGYNSKAKQKAFEILELGKKEYVNSMNLELRNEEYLIQDDYNSRISHLNPVLKKMKEYYEMGEDVNLFLVQMEIDNEVPEGKAEADSV